MNKRILIFTDNYPFGRSESFFDTELQFIERAFENVTIFPFETGKDVKMRPMNGKTETMKPLFNRVKNKQELLVKGIFNKSDFCRFFIEGVKSEVWKSGKLFRIWTTHMLVIRSILNEVKKRDLINLFNQFDVLYFYWGLRWSQILPFLPPDMQAKIVVRFHGSDLYEYTNKNYIPWRYDQLSRISKAVSISETGKKYIEDHYAFLKEKTIISRIGTKDCGLNPYHRSEITRIVSCSNLVPVKRVEIIVSALKYLRMPVSWIHFGEGPRMKEIKALAASLPDHINAELRGAVGHEELMEYFRSTSIDIFINVSSSEGVPVSVMEAMSFGIPVIATNAGGTSEIVSEKTGLLVDINTSPEELAGRIESFVSRENLTEIRKAAREAWEKKSMAENVYPPFIKELLSL